MNDIALITRKRKLDKITFAARFYRMSTEVQFITDDKGEKKSVILNINDYQSLMEEIEDLAACAERRNEGTIPHEDFLKELKEDGLL